MSELGAVQTYLYWSEKRIRKLAEDNNLKLEPTISVEVRTPSFGVLPEVGGSFAPSALSRQKIAERMERSIGRIAVENFVTPPPVRFAKGVGTMAFSEFYFNGPTGAAVTCTTSVASDGTRVAVCLFGSVENFAGMVFDGDCRRAGWYSSNAPAVLRFIQNGGTPDNVDTPWRRELPTLEWYAHEAFKIAFRQGEESGSDRVIDRPWRRGFSYGHIDDVAEWMADVYVDVAVPVYDDGLRRFDRIVVGAPVWIRTPNIRSWHAYDSQTMEQLDDKRG